MVSAAGTCDSADGLCAASCPGGRTPDSPAHTTARVSTMQRAPLNCQKCKPAPQRGPKGSIASMRPYASMLSFIHGDVRPFMLLKQFSGAFFRSLFHPFVAAIARRTYNNGSYAGKR